VVRATENQSGARIDKKFVQCYDKALGVSTGGAKYLAFTQSTFSLCDENENGNCLIHGNNMKELFNRVELRNTAKRACKDYEKACQSQFGRTFKNVKVSSKTKDEGSRVSLLAIQNQSVYKLKIGPCTCGLLLDLPCLVNQRATPTVTTTTTPAPTTKVNVLRNILKSITLSRIS